MHFKHWPRWMGGGSLPLTLPLVFALSVAACGGDGGGPGEDPVPPDDLIPGETVSYTAQRSNPWGLLVNEEPDYATRASRKTPEAKTARFNSRGPSEQRWHARIEAVEPGQWWPIGRHFVHFIGYHQGGVAIGRVVPVPTLLSTSEDMSSSHSGPNPTVLLPGTHVITGGGSVAIQLEQMNADTAVIGRYQSDGAPSQENYLSTVTVRAGEVIHESGFLWRIVAFHPGVGDLPPYVEARMEVRDQ